MTSDATAVFLDEYAPAGILVQSIAIPTTDSGTTHALTTSGSASSEGLLNLSSNGQFITLTGYDATPGTQGGTAVGGTISGGAAIFNSASSSINRVVGVVDASGIVNTSTALDALGGNNIRSAVSTDGTNLWVSGQPGIIYTTTGSTGTSFTSINTTNVRQLDIFGGQLYTSSNNHNTRVATVGSGTPTGIAGINNLPGFPTGSNNPYQFVLADLTPTVSGYDTLYVADDATDSGLQKWSLVSGTWMLNNTIVVANLRGLTGITIGTTEQLYGTTPGSLIGFTDATGYNQNLTLTPLQLAIAPTNTAFRGVDFAPSIVVAASSSVLLSWLPSLWGGEADQTGKKNNMALDGRQLGGGGDLTD